MKKIPVFTSVGLLLLIAGIIFFITNQSLIAYSCCTVAYFCAMKEVARYTSWYQFAVVFLSAILLGGITGHFAQQYPFAIIIFVLAVITTMIRIVLFPVFGYTSYAWFEPFMLTITVLLYGIGNWFFNSSWITWLMPLPVIVFAGFITKGILKDEKQLLAFTKSGYKIQIGRQAIEFALPDQDGSIVRLSDFKGKRHLLLIFVRGDWCPGCHMMLRTYEKNREKFQQKNIFVMAIGPDPVGVNREMVSKLGIDYKVLSDEGQKTAMVYGVQLSEYNHDVADTYKEGIPLPASFLIDINGIVRYVSRPDKVGEFLNPSLIFPIIEKLNA